MKIGFLCFHPGAVNTLTKVIKELSKDKNNELFFFPFIEYAIHEWGLKDTYVHKDSPEFFECVPKDLDVLIYSSAADSFVEREIPSFCKVHGIVSISTVDVFWIDENEIKRRFKTKPDIIITPEKSTKEMIENLNWGVKVCNLGNPHLELEKTHDGSFNFENKVLTYVSFPSGNEIKCDTDELSKKIMKELIEISIKNPFVTKLYLAPHPRENLNYIKKVVDEYNNIIKKIEINPYKTTSECCLNSDIIIGHSSTVLYEEMLKGKPVIFYKDKFQLENLLNSRKITNEIDFEIPTDSVKNIVHLILNCKGEKQ